MWVESSLCRVVPNNRITFAKAKNKIYINFMACMSFFFSRKEGKKVKWNKISEYIYKKFRQDSLYSNLSRRILAPSQDVAIMRRKKVFPRNFSSPASNEDFQLEILSPVCWLITNAYRYFAIIFGELWTFIFRSERFSTATFWLRFFFIYF